MSVEVQFEELVLATAAPLEPRAQAQRNEPRRIDNLTLVDGKSFFAATVGGDVTPASSTDVGLFRQDTRFLSQLELRVNGCRAVVLSANSPQNIASQIELTASSTAARDTLDMPDNAIHIRREQLLAGCLFDRLCFENYNQQAAEMDVEFRLDADFMDVFQVRGMHRDVSGEYFEPVVRSGCLLFAYLGRDGVFRRTWVKFDPAPEQLRDRQARYTFRLEPRDKRLLGLTVETGAEPYRPSESRRGPMAQQQGNPPVPAPAPASPAAATVRALELSPASGFRTSSPAPALAAFNAALHGRRQEQAAWSRETTGFASSNEVFDQCLSTAMSDFFSLRVNFDSPASVHCADGSGPAPASAQRGGEIIAAGIPWFATVFGRDSLIAGYQSLALHPQLARATLRFLAHRQGHAVDAWRDEEPGKILHELREGEMTRTGETPHSPYYGSIDSTPLFLIVLDETYAWTGDDALLEELLPAARLALAWIEQYGDYDGDGFVEYRRHSARGLANQAWKDSWDAYLHRDGTTVEPPIAPCEVQGYCFDAMRRMSRLLRRLGHTDEAAQLGRRATRLAHHFERTFWMEEEGFYAMSLDGAKNPQRTISSNAGHLLWSRMIGADRARQVAHRLMRADMFSGWGLRTLSADEPTFNPLSYHRGSVWPHDNSLIAQGFAYYDLKQPLERVFTGLFQTAAFLRDQRLPELFVGLQRHDPDRPVNYPVSCSPQAWASGAWFLLLTAALGLRPNAARRELQVVNPMLPEWLNWLRIDHLRIGQSQVSLEFSRRGTRTFCNVLDVQGERLGVSVAYLPS